MRSSKPVSQEMNMGDSGLGGEDGDEGDLWGGTEAEGNTFTDAARNVDLGFAAAQVAGDFTPTEEGALGVGRADEREDDLAAVGMTGEDEIGLFDAVFAEYVGVVAKEDGGRVVGDCFEGAPEFGFAFDDIIDAREIDVEADVGVGKADVTVMERLDFTRGKGSFQGVGVVVSSTFHVER